MPWSGSKKNSAPKLISVTVISPDEILSIPINNDERKDEKDTQSISRKKKFGTWGKKLGKKHQLQKKRTKSIGRLQRESSEDDEFIEKEKIINDFADLKKGSRIEAFRNFFRSTKDSKEATENIKISHQEEKSIKLNQGENLETAAPEIDPHLFKVNDPSPLEQNDKVNKEKNYISQSNQPLQVNEEKNHTVNSIRRVKSFTDFQSHKNSAIKITERNFQPGTNDEPKKSLTLSRTEDLCCDDKVCLDESGYISDDTQTGRVISSSVSTITNDESSEATKIKLSTHVECQSQSKVDESLFHLDSSPSTSSKELLRRNSWANLFSRTQKKRVTWPQKKIAQEESVPPSSPPSASKTNSINENTPLQGQAIDKQLKLGRKSFSTMTIHQQNQVTNYSPKLTGMKKFQKTKKTNLTEFTLTQLADSLSMDLIKVCLKKGEAKKLGFTIVGGAGSENTPNVGIFIKGILPDGQVAEEGTLRTGDMILAVNGQQINELMTHSQVIQIIRAVKPGEIIFHIGRKHSSLV